MTTFLEMLYTARRSGGKHPIRQLSEMVRLRLRRQPIGIGEYFDYGICDGATTPAKVDEFIGWRQSGALDKQLNEDSARVLANDKLLNYLVLRARGFPIPVPIASYSANGRQIDHERVLTTLEDVLLLLEEDVYPFYVKPISAGYGHGVLGVSGREDDDFRLLDGTLINLDGFLAPFVFAPYKGMLFQQPLNAHSDIAEITGTTAVSCVRFICFVTPRGPIIHTAFWKITTGRNMLDNFSHGDYGNCLGAIDLATGKVLRVISRMGANGQTDRHPTTGKQLIGVPLPDWRQAKDLVCSASKEFPGLRLQNWDVALCDSGPVLLELNTESELAVPQAISRRGLMDQQLRQILSEIDEEQIAYREAIARRNKLH